MDRFEGGIYLLGKIIVVFLLRYKGFYLICWRFKNEKRKDECGLLVKCFIIICSLFFSILI